LINTSSQTDSFVENMYTACPISDADVNTSLPSLVIEDLSSEEVTFTLDCQIKRHFICYLNISCLTEKYLTQK